MNTFEFIDFFTTPKNAVANIPLEDIMKQETTYKHTVYINFIDFISDIYKSCHFNVEDLERQVSVDIDRSNIFINETNIHKQEKSKWFLQYVKQNHRTNYIKILCLHNQAIYGQVLELLMGIINDPEIHIFELDTKNTKKKIMMKLIDIQTLEFISTKTLRIVKFLPSEELENLFLVHIHIAFTFGEPTISITFTIDKYKDVLS
jgi:hypothetical protein